MNTRTLRLGMAICLFGYIGLVASCDKEETTAEEELQQIERDEIKDQDVV